MSIRSWIGFDSGDAVFNDIGRILGDLAPLIEHGAMIGKGRDHRHGLLDQKENYTVAGTDLTYRSGGLEPVSQKIPLVANKEAASQRY